MFLRYSPFLSLFDGLMSSRLQFSKLLSASVTDTSVCVCQAHVSLPTKLSVGSTIPGGQPGLLYSRIHLTLRLEITPSPDFVHPTKNAESLIKTFETSFGKPTANAKT